MVVQESVEGYVQEVGVDVRRHSKDNDMIMEMRMKSVFKRRARRLRSS